MDTELVDVLWRILEEVEDEDAGNVLSRSLLDLLDEARTILEEV